MPPLYASLGCTTETANRAHTCHQSRAHRAAPLTIDLLPSPSSYWGALNMAQRHPQGCSGSCLCHSGQWSFHFSALLKSPAHPTTSHPSSPHSWWMHSIVLHKEVKNSQTEALFFCQVHTPSDLDTPLLLLPFCSRGKHSPPLLPGQAAAEILGAVPSPLIRSHCLCPLSFAASSFS